MRRSKKIRIAVQKSGRLCDASLDYLKSFGLKPDNPDKLISSCNKPGFEIIFVRSGDVPVYVQTHIADYGITGQNVLREAKYDVFVKEKLDFAICQLVIAVPEESSIKKIEDLEGERIATSYPKSLKKFLLKNGISAAVLSLSGSVEAAPAIGMADAICDLTQTGKTLEQNKLRVIAKVYDSQAILIESTQMKNAGKILSEVLA